MLKYQNSDSVYKYNKAANEQEWEKMQQIQEQKQQRQDIQLHHLIEKVLSAYYCLVLELDKWAKNKNKKMEKRTNEQTLKEKKNRP